MHRKCSSSHPGGLGEPFPGSCLPSLPLFTPSRFKKFVYTECLPVLTKGLSTHSSSFGCHRSTEPAPTASVRTNSRGLLLSSSGSLAFSSANYSLMAPVLHSFGLPHTTSSWGPAHHFGFPFVVLVSQGLWGYSLFLCERLACIDLALLFPVSFRIR